jgi:hypothetical protein
MRRLLLLAAVTLAPAFAGRGIQPRPSSAGYPIHQNARSAAFGAALLTSRQVKAAFPGDLDRGYIVVEAAAFPEQGQTVKLFVSDFAIRYGDELVYALDSTAVTAALEQKRPDNNSSTMNPPSRVSATAGVGRASGSADPTTGRRPQGWETYGGVSTEPDIGSYPRPDPPPSQSRRNVLADIEDRALPEGPTVNPVAGYLYFPVPSKARKNAQFTLVYMAGDPPVELPLPQEKR